MFAVCCLSLVLTPPPVATLTVSDPTRLAEECGELLGTKIDFVAGRDLSAWRWGDIGIASLTRLDGLSGPTPPLVLTLPMTASQFCTRVLTAAERESIPVGESRFTCESAAVWHFAAVGDSVVLSPDARLLGVRHRRLLKVMESLGGATLRIDLARVRQLAGKEITAATQFATLMLRTGGAPWLKGFDTRQRETVAKLVGAAHRIVADGEELWLTADATRTGLRVATGWACGPKTLSAKFLAAEMPTELDEWRDLPLAYPVAVRKLSPAVARALAQLNPEFAAAPGDAASAIAIADYQNRLAAAGLVTEFGGTVRIPDPDGQLGKSYEAALRSLRKGAAYRNVPLRAMPTVSDHCGEFSVARIPLDLDAATAGIADANLRQAAFASIEKLTPREPSVSFGNHSGRFVRGAKSRAALDAADRTDTRAGGNLELMRARAMLPEKLSAFVGLDMAETLRTAVEFATTLESALPAFPGWEVPTIDAKVLRRGVTPFAAGARLSPGGVELVVALPTAAVRMIWTAIEK